MGAGPAGGPEGERRGVEKVFVPGPAAAILCQCGTEEEAAAGERSGDSAAAAAAAGPDTASLVTVERVPPRLHSDRRAFPRMLVAIETRPPPLSSASPTFQGLAGGYWALKASTCPRPLSNVPVVVGWWC